MSYSETKTEVIKVDSKTSLLTRIWLPAGAPKAVFLAIHGGMVHAGDWGTGALVLAKKGIATYAPDLRWHGTYPQYNEGGKVVFHLESYDEPVNDIHVIYKRIKELHPGVPVFIMAHSNGALIALKYGLTIGKDTDIKGFILSSPWLKNKVNIPPLIIALSKVLSKIVPMMAVPPEPLLDKLTRDPEITARHHADEAKGLRSTKVTVRLGAESMKTQEWVVANIKNWKKFPVFGVVAGQDFLADPEVSEKAFKSITAAPVTFFKYEDNYHENFNELNRAKIFDDIVKWTGDIIQKKTVIPAKPAGKAVKKSSAKPAANSKKTAAKAKPVKTKPAASKTKPKPAAPKAKPKAKGPVKAKKK